MLLFCVMTYPQTALLLVNTMSRIIQKSFRTKCLAMHNSLAHSETLNSIPPNVGCSFCCDATMNRVGEFAKRLASI